jgi:hypothetical protein
MKQRYSKAQAAAILIPASTIFLVTSIGRNSLLNRKKNTAAHGQGTIYCGFENFAPEPKMEQKRPKVAASFT